MASSGSREEARERDLILLVADANMESTMKGLLSRPKALGIRAIRSSVVPHPERDPGAFLRAPEFLQPFRGRFRHALVLLDREGSGREQEMSRGEMEEDLEERLAAGWGEDRCAAVVLDPELEVWLWSDSPHVERVLGWKGRDEDLRSWLEEAGYLQAGDTKPARPKEAVEKALRIARKPRSSALYRELAGKVSLRSCVDPSFRRVREILRHWFPETPPVANRS